MKLASGILIYNLVVRGAIVQREALGVYVAEIEIGETASNSQRVPVQLRFDSDINSLRLEEELVPQLALPWSMWTPMFQVGGVVMENIPFMKSADPEYVLRNHALAGELGLSHTSRIANQFRLRLAAESINRKGSPTDGFTVSFLPSQELSAPFEGTREVAAPIIQRNDVWSIEGSITIAGNPVATLGEIEINPTADKTIVLPFRAFQAVFRRLNQMYEMKLVFITTEKEEFSTLSLPCNSDGFIHFPPDFSLGLELDGERLDIQIPRQCRTPPRRGGLDLICDSVFRSHEGMDTTTLGLDILNGRHSIVFDGKRKELTFVEYKLIPLNAARPILPGFSWPGPVGHAVPEISGEGISFPQLAHGGYLFRPDNPFPLWRMGRRESTALVYSFDCITWPHVACTDESVFGETSLPGLYHFDAPSYSLVHDQATGRLTLPISEARDFSRIVFAITIDISGPSMVMRAVQVDDLTHDFESLEIAMETTDSKKECCICMNDKKVKSAYSYIEHCKHSFHTMCLQNWMEVMLTCPVCRCSVGVRPNSFLRRRITTSPSPATEREATDSDIED